MLGAVLGDWLLLGTKLALGLSLGLEVGAIGSSTSPGVEAVSVTP
jgi:hypothetical protein